MGSYYDDLVNEFVLEKFRERWINHNWNISFLSEASRRSIQHQLACETSRADVKRCEWECGCWSEWTREDMFAVKFIVSCDCHHQYHVVTSLDLQGESVMEQLSEYESTRECIYEDE
jgi:hypothetical protein